MGKAFVAGVGRLGVHGGRRRVRVQIIQKQRVEQRRGAAGMGAHYAPPFFFVDKAIYGQ